MIIKVKSWQILESKEFANRVFPTVKHRLLKKGHNLCVAKKNFIDGRRFEWGICNLLEYCQIENSRPDGRILRAKEKSYNPDLIAYIKQQSIPILCKQQEETAGIKWGISWMGEKDDIHLDPTSNSYIALGLTKLNQKVVELLAFMRVSSIPQSAWGKAILHKRYPNKVAIYMNSDLKKSNKRWEFFNDFNI
jgi:hypothetical protein